jgi:hypothetical protein
MSKPNTLFATRQRRRAAAAALCVFAVVAIVACDGRGSGLIGTGGTPSVDASLRSLTVSAGTLTPAFDSATTSYSDVVTFGTASMTVTPVPRAPGSVVTVNGTVVASGSTSPSIPLTAGVTSQILVKVLAADTLTARTYTILVVRPIS